MSRYCDKYCCEPVKVVCCNTKPGNNNLLLLGLLLLVVCCLNGKLPKVLDGRGNANINVINVNGEDIDEYDHD